MSLPFGEALFLLIVMIGDSEPIAVKLKHVINDFMVEEVKWMRVAKRLLTGLMLSAVTFTGLISPLGNLARADDGGADKNIYKDSNAKVTGAVNEAASYSEGMQYLVTYSILHSMYGSTGSESDYGKIYDGAQPTNSVDKNNPYTGIPDFAFGGTKVYEAAKAGKTETEGSKESSTVEDNANDYDKKVQKLAEEMASTYVDWLGQYFGVGSEAIKVSGKDDAWYNWGGEGVSTVVRMDDLVYDSRKSAKNPVSGSSRELMRKVIVNYIKKSLGVSGSAAEVYKGMTIDDSVMEQWVADYRSGISTSKPVSVSQAVNQVMFEISGKKTNTDANKTALKKYASYVPEVKTEMYSSSDKKALNKDLAKKKTDYYNKIKGTSVWKDFAKAKKATEDQAQDGANNVASKKLKALAWMPLTPSLKNSDIKSDKSFVDSLSKFDGSKFTDTRLQTKDGKNRAVQVNDLFAGKKKSSPVFVYNTDKYENDYMGMFFGGSSKQADGSSTLGRYIGLEGEGGNWLGSAGKIKTRSSSDDTKSYSLALMQAITADTAGKNSLKMDLDTSGSDTVGIDNYGNIIDANTGTVLIPYWQNRTVSELNGLASGGEFVSSSVFRSNKQGFAKQFKDLKIGSKVSKVKERSVSDTAIEALAGSSAASSVKRVKNSIPSKVTYEDMASLVAAGGKNAAENEANIRALALIITAGTSKEVKNWNESFKKYSKDAKEMYITKTDGGYGDGTGNSDSDALAEYTNADLRERIMMILDTGFYEVLRLTIASMVVSIYTSSFINFSMSSVFYTQTITQTAMWSDLLSSLSLLLMGITGVYIIFMAFKVFRKTMSGKDFVRQFILITFVLVIPAQIYGPLINFVLNVPTDKVVGKQIQQTSILDTSLDTEAKKRENDEYYAKLFGGSTELRDRSQDYVIYFYTTQHKSGFDVTSENPNTATFKDQIRSIEAKKTGKWNKNDVIRVGVSAYDLFDWVKATVDKKKNKDENLFEWLAANKNEDGRYDGITDYQEYHINTNKTFEALGVKTTNGYKNLTASNLFRMMYEEASNDKVKDRIQNIYLVSEAIRNGDHGSDVVTDDEREALMRDLSMTKKSRQSLYGSKKSDPKVSYKAQKLMDANGLEVPNNDFLNLESVVNKLVPYRDPTTTTLDRDVYDINRKVLDDYVETYSVVRESIGGDGDQSFNQSEYLMMILDAFFATNNTLDLPMFPTTYQPETVSFDSYMRMAFIPLKEFTSDNVELNNVAQYLALRDNPFVLLFFFLPALVALMVFGMIFIAVFYVVMMVVMVISFIWHYVVKFDKNNKSWLGALMIIGSFAIAKFGLILLWRGMSYFLNYTTVNNGGITYPYTLIHSLIIVAYIFFIVKYLLLRVFKAVLKDKGNLGGELFTKGVSETISKFGNKLNGGLFGGRSSGSPESASAIDHTLGNEGSDGKLLEGIAGINLGGLAKKVWDKFKGDKHDAADIGEYINASVNQDNFGAKAKNRFKGLTSGAAGRAMESVLDDLDEITASTSGLSDAALSALKDSGQVGQILQSSADGSIITAMNADNPEHAELIASHLRDQGINAKVDEDNVVFDSSKFDLTDAGVRKGLFGDLLPKLYQEVDGKSQIEYQDVDNPLNYTKNDDGSISLNVGDKGLSQKSLNTLINSKAFSDSFEMISPPVKDANGNFIPGTFDVEAKTGVNIQEAVEGLFKSDTAMREVNGEQARGSLGLDKAMTFNVEDPENEDLIYDHMVDGMKLQDGQVVYDSTDQTHVAAINKISNKLRAKTDIQQQDKIDLMRKLSSQIVMGGDNGFQVESISTAGNSEAQEKAMSMGLLHDGVNSTVFAGEDAANIATNLNQVKNVINANPQTVTEFTQNQEALYRAGEELMVGKNQDYDKALLKMNTFAEANNVDDGRVTNIMNDYQNLINMKENNDIREVEYTREVEKLMSDMQTTLQDHGVYEKAVSEELRKSKSKESKEILDNFIKSKKVLKDQGIDTKVLSSIQTSDLDTLGQLIGDIEDVRPGEDGLLNVTSASRLDEGDTSRLIEQMQRLHLPS